jgi:drug/metabolite transporter (DMT)-like permease
MNYAYVLSFALASFSCFFYHILQKTTPASVNPAVSLAATYAVAFIVTVATLPLFPLTTSLATELRSLPWVSYVLGFSVVGIELGFLLAYRAGWDASMAALSVNALTALALVLASYFLFKSTLGARQIIGGCVCLVGLWLMSRP